MRIAVLTFRFKTNLTYQFHTRHKHKTNPRGQHTHASRSTYAWNHVKYVT